MATDALFEFLCRMGDNTLVLGHRLSEWCGKAPVIEEDIALANIGLDLIGQTQMWLALAAEVEGADRSADDLAMGRDVWDFRNLLLVEQPNENFGHTMMRQFLFDAWHLDMLTALTDSSNQQIADIAAKSVKEVTYHLERSADTVIALGDGTELSHQKMQTALNILWPFALEMFTADATDQAMAEAKIAPLPDTLKPSWHARVSPVLSEATLTPPDSDFAHQGGKSGRQHSEHLGHLLSSMQFLYRAYPGANW